MRRMVFAGLVLLLGIQAIEAAPAMPEKLIFQDLYGHNVTLSSAETTPACVLFFFSNTCPVARRYVPRILQLAAVYRPRGVEFIAVNISPADSLDEVARFAMDYEFTFPVVKDLGFNAVKALGISRTPEVAVLGRDFAMVYRGRIDDQYRLGGVRPEATRHDLAEALDALLDERPVPVSQVPAEGCVITVPAEIVAVPDSAPEPDPGIYNAEWVGSGSEGEDRLPGKRTWNLDSGVAASGWVRALRVDGSFQSASLYYIEEGTDARHYLAGALLPGQPLRWNDGDAVRLPAEADLQLDTTGEMLRAPEVCMNITDTAPDWAITCIASSSGHVEDNYTSPLTIHQRRPSRGEPRSISLDISHFGMAINIEFIPEVGKPITLLSLPLLDPREPGPHPLAELSAVLEEPGSLRATLRRVGYLTWPTAVSPNSDSETVITLFTYRAERW